MELSSQIKKYRAELKLSQEELAEKVYVSRQTVSNWETEKSYPDIHSLLLLSSLFDISLDQLIKGDVKIMREEINAEEMKKYNKMGRIYSLLFVAMVVSSVPLVKFLGIYGMLLWGILAVIALVVAFRVEKLNKKHNIHTYKEIVSFMEGKKLDEIEQYREEGKRPYQNVLKVVGGATIALVVCGLMGWLLNLF